MNKKNKMEAPLSIKESEKISKIFHEIPIEERTFNLKLYHLVEKHNKTGKDYKTLINEYAR